MPINEYMQTKRVEVPTVLVKVYEIVEESICYHRVKWAAVLFALYFNLKYWMHAKATMSKDIAIPPMENLRRNTHLDLRTEFLR